MKTFDPFGWAARFVPEHRLHSLLRWGGVAVFAALLVVRAGEYARFALKPLWAAETFVFVALGCGYLVRSPPVDRSRGFRETLVPLAGALLPFALLLSPPAPWVAGRRGLVLAVFWWMTAGTALTGWALWTLRGSFSITVEARSAVTGGPYRWVRHPVYLGEMTAAAAVVFWRFSAANAALFALFVTLQLLRARWEERKLCRSAPGYREYAPRAWWFW